MKRLRRFFSLAAVLVIALGVFCATASVQARWKKEGVEVAKGQVEASDEIAISDKNSVIFIFHNKAETKHYIQKINKNGEKTWGKEGLLIAGKKAYNFKLIKDELGGAIVAYENGSNEGYVLRINKYGKEQWSRKFTENIFSDVIISDGRGGAIVASSYAHYYLTRIGSDGGTLWKKSREEIFHSREQEYIGIVADKKGYFYVGTYQGKLQKIDRNGRIYWSAEGLNAVLSKNFQMDKMLMNQKNEIVITGRKDYKGLYLQKVGKNGKRKWSKPLLVSEFLGDVYLPVDDYDTASNNKGEIVITWKDKRADKDGDIYGQWFNNKGKRLWGKNGKAIAASSDWESNPHIIFDNQKKIFISWVSGEGQHFQKLNKSGVPQWANHKLFVGNLGLIQKIGNNFIALMDTTKYVTTRKYEEIVLAYKIDQNGNFVGE